MKLPSGFRIGHYTNRRGLTGCTVILCPPNTIGGCDVRGNSPASRETPLLAADKAMQEIHAVVLSGGSAFGLAAADGVMEYLESRRIGYRTPWARIPIVAAAAIFDLNIGSAHTRPDRRQAIRACQSARRNNRSQGNVGAGTGATVGKWAGADYRMKGGLGLSSIESGKLIVGCIAVVNCVGDVVERDGSVLAGARSSDGIFLGEGDRFRKFRSHRILAKTNTTLIVLVTNAAPSKVGVNRLAQRAHDGMARAIVPVHTSYDGDVSFALASNEINDSFDHLAEIGAEATAEAIPSAVRHSRTVGGVMGIAG